MILSGTGSGLNLRNARAEYIASNNPIPVIRLVLEVISAVL